MPERLQAFLPRVTVWALCLFAGLAIGLSGFDAESNHPTYLPPGIRYVAPGFLAHDWWLNAAHHYHLAFFGLVAALTFLGILELGLAALNVAAVAVAMAGLYRIIRLARAPAPAAALAIVIALLLASYAFCTIGWAYLFSASLQPSTIATTATILAMVAFLQQRRGECGLWLALGGLFHANFLVLNIAAFGLASLLEQGAAQGPRKLVERTAIMQLARLLGPSMLLLALTAPFLLGVQADSVSDATRARAEWIFFHYAVPFHYDPRTYLSRFPAFLALQTLGFLWTSRAIPDLALQRRIRALQLALGAMLWTASLLTTVVFIPAVSRFFVWRLAPLALLLAALLLVIGMIRIIAEDGTGDATRKADLRRLRWSALLLPLLAFGTAPLQRQMLPTAGIEPIFYLSAALWLAATLHNGTSRPRRLTTAAGRFLCLTALAFGLLTQPSAGRRYSLIYQSPEQRAQDALFAWVAGHSPTEAQFLIPPDLDYFRLKAARAVVVDEKALPMNPTGIAEWYDRLRAESGLADPSAGGSLLKGYQAMSAARLAALHCRYHADYAVFALPNDLATPGWSEVYRNGRYRVLRLTGGAAPACSPDQAATP